MAKNIPVYSLDQFKKDTVRQRPYQVEVFNKDRSFQVEYPHRHDNFYEILFLTQGSGHYTIDFKKYPILANHVYFVSPGQVHTIEYSPDILGFIFLFTGEFYMLEKTDKNKLFQFPFFHGLTYENPPFQIPNPEELETIFNLLCRELKSDSETNAEIALSALDLILNICKKNYPFKEEEKYTGKGRLLVKQFKQLVEENYRNQHLVREYANTLNVTPNHLNETVKQLTGITAKELIKERQIIEIKRLLSHTELNINEIALAMNFEDQSYFSRFFRKNTGISPNTFRENLSS